MGTPPYGKRVTRIMSFWNLVYDDNVTHTVYFGLN